MYIMGYSMYHCDMTFRVPVCARAYIVAENATYQGTESPRQVLSLTMQAGV